LALALASPEKANIDHTAFKNQQCWDILVAAIGRMPMVRAEVPAGGLNGASARLPLNVADWIALC
jgi:hypothetical protein